MTDSGWEVFYLYFFHAPILYYHSPYFSMNLYQATILPAEFNNVIAVQICWRSPFENDIQNIICSGKNCG